MKKLRKKLEDFGPNLYIICLFVFAVLTLVLGGEFYLALAEAVVALVFFIVSRITSRAKQRELVQYIESVTYETEEAKNSAMMNFPLPMVTYLLNSGRIVWGNEEFFAVCGYKKPKLDASISDLVPDFEGKWILEGKNRAPGLVALGERRFQVLGNLIRAQGEDRSASPMGITYWIDVTDYDDIKREYVASRPVIMLILLDNLDEITKTTPTDRAKNDLRNEIEDKLSQWVEGTRGLLRRLDRERYMFICERRYYDRLREGKFSIVDAVHSVVNPTGIHATVSVGVGIDGASFEENFSFASMSVEMALSRGGDQAVIRNRMNFDFFGGRGTEVETRTKVKSRVVANALGSFMKDASTTYIMGHRYADMDALGAAVGICCIARHYGKKARIVLSDRPNACTAMVEELKKHKEYADVFITPKEAMLQANSRSLLVVVDTNRPEQVEDPALLQTISRLVVIDHHRRAASYIENASLTFYEPYASSVCELVTELLQELVEQENILGFEAEALLAGIVTDTKNFTLRAGERTFDAAAFLRRTGADPASVKRVLQNDFGSTVTRYAILERAQLYRNHICIAAMDQEVNRVVAAQAADEMLNISGIEASIVLFPNADGSVQLSARSLGELNCQMVLEKLGGGGNTSAAGCTMHDIAVDEALQCLKAAIDEYLAEDEHKD